LTLIYWKNIAGETKLQNFKDATNSLDRFSLAQTVSLFILIVLTIVERMLYRGRYVDPRDDEGKYCTMPEQRNPNVERKKQKLKTTGIRHLLTLKLVIYYVLIFAIHIYCGFIIPQYQIMPMLSNYWLALYYCLWMVYFYYSGLQIKEGYPF
jgi:hypothetical protein